jgi:hypothetical protein
MIEKDYLFELLFRAFLDIRIASYAKDSHTCFVLADVFHNVPLQMNSADKGERTYAEIIADIKERCERRQCTFWLDAATSDIMRRHSA